MNARITQLPVYEPESFDAQVGHRIKSLLVGRATQATLGEKLGLGQPEISKRLRGYVAWKAHEIGDVAAALGVSVSVLYGETSVTEPTETPTLDYGSAGLPPRIAPVIDILTRVAS